MQLCAPALQFASLEVSPRAMQCMRTGIRMTCSLHTISAVLPEASTRTICPRQLSLFRCYRSHYSREKSVRSQDTPNRKVTGSGLPVHLCFAMSALNEDDGVSSGLVTVEWLNQRKSDPDIKILDGSWYLPNVDRDPVAEFAKERIVGSSFFDVDQISDTSSPLPHMLPSPDSFAASADCLGVTNDSTVIVYDRAGIFSAPRVWWTFRAFGHKKVAVLNGGYPAWQAAGYEIDRSPLNIEEVKRCGKAAAQSSGDSRYQPQKQASLVKDVDQVLGNVESLKEDVIDARGPPRFQGTAPEPRKGVRGGHIPGSLNVPFDSLLVDGRYKSKDGLVKAFKDKGLSFDKPVIASCGTGVTASVLALGLHVIRPDHAVAVYDGSWTEWGSREDTPIATGKCGD